MASLRIGSTRRLLGLIAHHPFRVAIPPSRTRRILTSVSHPTRFRTFSTLQDEQGAETTGNTPSEHEPVQKETETENAVDSSAPTESTSEDVSYAAEFFELAGVPSFGLVQQLHDPEMIANVLRIANDPKSDDSAILEAVKSATWSARRVLGAIAYKIDDRRDALKIRLLRVVINDAEPEGLPRAVTRLMDLRLKSLRNTPDSSAISDVFVEANNILAKFVERNTPMAYTLRAGSARLEAVTLKERGELTDEKLEEIARPVLALLSAAAESEITVIKGYALTALGDIYAQGTLVPSDPEKARTYWEAATAAGSSTAAQRLAMELSPLRASRLLPQDNAAGLAYATSTLVGGRLPALAGRWYYRRPDQDEKTHEAFWGVAPDDKKAADLSAWAARTGMGPAMIQWAEMLLFDRADLNSGLGLIDQFFSQIDSKSHDDQDALLDEDDADSESDENAEESGDGSRFPYRFTAQGRKIREPTDRPSTRLEKLDTAMELLTSFDIRKKDRVASGSLYRLVTKMWGEAKAGGLGIPDPKGYRRMSPQNYSPKNRRNDNRRKTDRVPSPRKTVETVV